MQQLDWLILFLSIDWLFIVTEVTRVLLSLFLWFTKSDKNDGKLLSIILVSYRKVLPTAIVRPLSSSINEKLDIFQLRHLH